MWVSTLPNVAPALTAPICMTNITTLPQALALTFICVVPWALAPGPTGRIPRSPCDSRR